MLDLILDNLEMIALLSVFQSVFDESCGYYREGYIAKLERDLDEKVQFIDKLQAVEKWRHDNSELMRKQREDHLQV